MDPYLRIAMSRLSKKTGALLIYIANKFDRAFEYAELKDMFCRSNRISLKISFWKLVAAGYLQKTGGGSYQLKRK